MCAVDFTAQRDELGAMARAVVVFKDNAVAMRRLQTEQAQDRERADAEKRAALVDMAGRDRDRGRGFARPRCATAPRR